MSYLVDTNVLSELARPNPAPGVLTWFAGIPESALYLSVLTLGELRKGVERLDSSARRERLITWLEHDVIVRFGERLLPLNLEVAERWGRLLAHCERTLPAIDGLLAATALHHNLSVVTRNVADFTLPGLTVINPWTLS